MSAEADGKRAEEELTDSASAGSSDSDGGASPGDGEASGESKTTGGGPGESKATAGEKEKGSSASSDVGSDPAEGESGKEISSIEAKLAQEQSSGPIDLQTAGKEMIGLLYGLMRSLSLYDTNNSAIVRQLDNIMSILGRAFEGGATKLHLQLLVDEFFVNGRLVKVDGQLYERGAALAELLKRYDFGEVFFDQQVSREDVQTFIADLGASVRSGRSQLKAGGYGSIATGKTRGQARASFRFQPDRLALWAYGGLLDVVDRLYEEHEAHHSPSLLPLKRAFQLIIDEMSRHSGLYQLLATVRDPHKALDRTRMRVSISINAVGFGVFLNLPHTSSMTLALGGILGGLSESKEPDDAIRPLYRFPGLGDSAMPLALAVRDARAARKGQSAGVPGRILSVAETYEELTAATSDRGALSPHHALRAMVEGIVGAEPALSQLFAEYKGTYPLGTPLRLDDERLAVVVAQTKGAQGRERPIVGVLGADNKLGERINLLEHPELTIKKAISPAEISLDLVGT